MAARSLLILVGLPSAFAVLAGASPAAAQERVPIDIGPPVVSSLPEPEDQGIDVLAPPEPFDTATAAQAKECEDALEASEISGEIVVCRKLKTDDPNRYSGSHAAWLKDYAERSKNFNTIPAPDVAGGGIFRGEPTFGGMCFIPPCPKDPALLVDVEALPPPPEGSDAERIAKGLPPLGQDEDLSEEEIRKRREALGLPPPRFEIKGE